MINLINKIYEKEKHKNITKKEIKEMIYFLKDECKYTEFDLSITYYNSGIEGIAFMIELEKFQKNKRNI